MVFASETRFVRGKRLFVSFPRLWENALFSRMVICPSNLVFEYKFFRNANQTMFSYLNFKRIFTRKRGWTGILPYVRRAYWEEMDLESELIELFTSR